MLKNRLLLLAQLIACAVPVHAMEFDVDLFPLVPNAPDVIAIDNHDAPPAFSPAHDVRPMDIDQADDAQHVVEVKTLKTLALDAIQPHVLQWFKQSDDIQKILDSETHAVTLIPAKFAKIPGDVKPELMHRIMFGSNDAMVRRNPAIVWLMHQCHPRKSMSIHVAEEFFKPIVECNGMSARKATLEEFQVVRAQENGDAEVLWTVEHHASIRSTEFSQDGRYLYFLLYDLSLGVLDVQTGQIVHHTMLESKRRSSAQCAFIMPNKQFVVCGTISALKLFDIWSGTPVCDLMHGSGDLAGIEAIKASPDGNRIYVIYQDALVDDENMLDQPALRMHIYDISLLNQMMHLVQSLTLEQLLTVQIVYQIAQNQEQIEVLNLPHIRPHYASLPIQVRQVIEQALPGIRADEFGATEPVLKRLRPDSQANRE